MHLGLRLHCSVVAAGVLGLSVRAAEQAGLPAGSPFLSGGNPPALAATPPGGLEFVAVLADGKKTSVNLYDPLTNKSHWIPVHANMDGIAVLSYDAASGQVVIRTGGTEKRLTLRRERGVIAGAISAAPAPVAGGSATTSTTLAPGAKSMPLPTPPAMAKEQQDARLLVSDLLEIGLEQRKAYEAAQKKAAAPTQTDKPPGG